MGRSASDIIQRISLNGSAFSAETNRIYAEMEAGARNTAARTKTHFEQSFQNVQQIAARALTMPANAKGGLTLDVEGARGAASAAELQAAALRQVASAAEAAAIKQGDTSEATRIYVQAARAAATEAEGNARSLHQQAAALDLLQLELNQTASATDLVIAKNRLMERSTRGGGIAMVQASQQVQDFFIQVSTGANAVSAFAMQASQMAYVMQGTGGVAGKLAGILSGPWGAAILGGITLVGLFAGKLGESGDALQKATDKIKKQATETEVANKAHAAWAKTTEGLVEASRKLEEQTRHLNESSSAAAQRAIDEARRTMLATVEKRKEARATLEQVKANLLLADARERVAALDPRFSQQGDKEGSKKRLAEIEAEIAKLNKAIADGGSAVQELTIAKVRQDVERATDAAAAANDRYRVSIERLESAYRSSQKTEGDRLKLERGSLAAARRRDREIEAAREREREQKKAERDAGKAEQRMRLLDPVTGRVSSGFGQRTPPKAGASSNHTGIDIAVPVGTGVRAGGTGVVVSVGNMGKLGKAVVVDYGDKVIATYGHLSEILVSKGQSVSAGDVIARSGNTGNSTGPHLHYGVTKDGRPIDPRRATVREGAGDKAAAELAQDAAEQRKKEAEQYDRIMVASQRQLDVEAESLRFQGLKLRGLDEQSAVEADIARKQREHADRMAELTSAQRREQAQVHPMMNATLAVFRSQADVYAGLIEKAGDQVNLTQDQRQALDDANAAMLTQLDAARALAKTAEDRHQIEVAIARVQGRLSTADGKAKDRARADKQAAEDLKREMEELDRERDERQRDQIYSLANFYRDAFQGGTDGIVENFKDEMLDVISQVAARWTIALLSGQKTSLGSILSDMGATSGVGGGGLIGGLLGSIGGGKKSGAASLVPGIGDLAAVKGGGLLGGLGGVGGAISSALPYAAIAMAVLPLISSLFASPKWGSAGLSLNGGVVSGAQGVGKGASQIKAATGNAGSVAEGINRLAEQLGATITGIPGVTIGSWDGKARVALTNTSEPLHAKSKAGKAGLIKDFGEGGEQEAIQFAIQYAFTNAALEGISQASKNIIKAGGDDVASAITKALLIEDVPKRLQALLDPVGYAVDTFNKSWEKTIAALKEGGASAEQMAQAQQLYKLELEQTKASAREASSDLKEFLKGLNFGSASPYSLRDQERMAAEAFKPFEEAILKGERIDQGKYQEAAQSWLDLQRQLYGSTGAFFEAMDKVQSLTGKAISDIDNAKPIRVETDPWVKATANSTQASAELLSQVSGQLDTISQQLAALGGAGGDAFIGGSARLFQNEAA